MAGPPALSDSALPPSGSPAAGIVPDSASGCAAIAQDAELLRSSPLLEDFHEAEAAILGRYMERVLAAPGQQLITEGQINDWMLLLAGTVDVTKRRPDGSATRLAVVGPGAVLGEMSMLDGEARYATCTAIEAVAAAVLRREAMGRLIADHPAVGAKLLVKITQLLAQRLRNTSNQLVRKVDAESAG